jgi:uncharacterized protein (DUF58 family)
MAGTTPRRHIAFRRGRSVRLTARGRLFLIAAVVLILFAYGFSNPVLLLLGLFCGTLTLLGLVLAITRTLAVTVGRSFSPQPVTANGDTTVMVEVTNDSRFASAPSYWNDTIPWRPLATDAAAMPRLRAKQGKLGAGRARMTYTLTPPRRGSFEVGPLLLAYADPFGMAVSFVSAGGRDPLIVTPQIVPLADSGIWLEAPDGTARLVQSTGVGSADDLMTREYRRGDALRRVHWRASARHGELMVRQEEQRAFPEATIVLDTRVTGYLDFAPAVPPEPATSEYFEWAVTMVASLGVHLRRASFAVHVIETSAKQIVPLADDGARFAHEDDFLMSLAGVDLTRERGRLTRATTGTALGPVFAIVSTPDDDVMHRLLELRRPFELGVVFLVGANARFAGRFLEAGWRVIPVDEETDPAIAWAALVDDVGGVHVGG